MSDKIALIGDVQKRGSVFLRFNGPPGSVRIVSRGGCSIRMEAGKTYEIDCRNPVLMAYSLKQQCLVLDKPKLDRDVKEKIGKKVSGKNLQNTFTTFKAKVLVDEPVKELVNEAGDLR